MSSKLDVMYNKPLVYLVLADESRTNWFISVVTGSTALDWVSVKLSAEEVQAFERDEAALDYLADQVGYTPGRFTERRVSLNRRDRDWEWPS
jgi:hypothetical protein